MKGIKYMTEQILKPSCEGRYVNHKDYQSWCQGFVFEALRNRTYGQSFCATFDIQDNLLMHVFRTVDEADEYIRKTYIR